MQPYRKVWWNEYTSSSEEDATVLEVEQRAREFTHSKRFEWPKQRYEAEDYMRALDWAAEYGAKHKKKRD